MSHSKSIIVDQKHDPDVGFISRWSQLKRETNQKTIKIAAKKKAETLALDELHASPERILTDDDMPDIKTMTADSNYADFFSSGVSEQLRKLALRKLFHNEEFNICDGLDEYDGDYTQFEKMGSLVTADMQHQIELLAKRQAEQLRADEAIDEMAVDESHIVDDEPVPGDIQHDESQTLRIADEAVTNTNVNNHEPS